MIQEAIVKIVDKQDLTYDEAYTVMNEIMSGQTSPTQNAAFLAALSTKSTKAETIDDISGCATTMRDHAPRWSIPALRYWISWAPSALALPPRSRLPPWPKSAMVPSSAAPSSSSLPNTAPPPCPTSKPLCAIWHRRYIIMRS